MAKRGWPLALAAAVTLALVSLASDVTTVSVSAPPCLAYTVPPTFTVPAPPLKTALLTLAAVAGTAARPPRAAAVLVTTTSMRRAHFLGPGLTPACDTVSPPNI